MSTYSRRGIAVFPVYPPGDDGGCACNEPACKNAAKHPIPNLAPHGLNDATTDAATIRQWWGVWPDANVAVRTGAASGLVVIDVDPRHGGDETIKRLEAEHGILPTTPTVMTGGGGWHVWFRHPAVPVPSRADALGRGVDVKADGGYVLAPPSLHVSGKRYEWAPGFRLDALPLAPLPAWVRGRLGPSHPRPATLEPDELLREGQRNDRLCRVGGVLRRANLRESEIRAALLAINAERGRPPLDDREVERIAESVARYQPAQQSPRDITNFPSLPDALRGSGREGKFPGPPRLEFVNGKVGAR